MENVTIPKWEYNATTANALVVERALGLLMEQMGVYEITIGNVYVYGCADGGVDGWFVNEKGERLEDIDYAFAFGVSSGGGTVASGCELKLE